MLQYAFLGLDLDHAITVGDIAIITAFALLALVVIGGAFAVLAFFGNAFKD